MDTGSPYQWLREQIWDNRGLYLIRLLNESAYYVASGNVKEADKGLEYISQLASPDGDALQRMATYFSEALAYRIVKNLPGVSRALNSSKPSSNSDEILVQQIFSELCPFLKVAYSIRNQAIVESMKRERMIHIIDLHCSEWAHWVDLLQTLKKCPEGPPHLKITGIHEKKEVLDQVGFHLATEAGKLNFPLRFYPIVSKLEGLDIDRLPINCGEALAVISMLQLHSFLATDDEMVGQTPPAAPIKMHRAMHMNPETFAEWLERDLMNTYFLSPDSALSALSLGSSPMMGSFLNALQNLQPKLMVITEQESNLNGCNLMERFERAMHFYGALFDCLDSTPSIKRQKLESMLFGEEIKNIIACEGVGRKERHEKLERWIPRLEMAGFALVPISFWGKIQAKNLLVSCGKKYKIREQNKCLLMCWSDRPIFSVSAWESRR